ncbi:polyhydroxyalkanoic acid system family protein [Bradyrhizobium sp. U87765 SZCCT0131]|uniref:polyhydroxyalkanoic acid system family protein n=1 Tax=unclassified Bradyrhizobium TaxID=2631580 RepID=UPI001BA7564B|nr:MULTISPECIES: polyhydroxyalkanoic acid system family protein [unclassified Bradyrhizobium]MBR1219256.1 polyhydroxyalkanoic acid system family protein [Bradyrhizobium sp. U87765 SZCCT0131]MBR1261907.1 polyhydroxyalkanoic acid system family protein [Bradyrhizobium sp. U87765 SZCCT0134]MBR1306240.1 polyhydroxyalkanoic acid system family protein [Bradyrhizobium sp. U87765 SZCCT0110]MBR1317689.1 polyhydroxyalkanoic acid system family protein [Bradyrhizobium sp. U87765 SZCCT0109]MBR1351391.1 poly
MAQPFIVSIPHKLGKDEALRRMKAGLASVKSQYGQLLQVNEEIWSGDRLAFRITAMKQQASGTVDVADDHVKLEVVLPWLLAGLAHGAQAMIRERANRMLEKKEAPPSGSA